MPLREDPPLAAEAIPGLHKGANQRSVPWAIDQNQAVEVEDVEVDFLGQWQRRRGTSPFGGIEAAPGGLGDFFDQANSQQYAWSVFGSEIFRSLGNGIWQQKACGVSLVSDRLHMMVEGIWSGTTGDQRALYVSQAIPSSGVTEASGITVFKGADAADFSQNASYAPTNITYFQGRLWKADDQVRGDGNDLGWSELDDGLTFSPANELSIEPGVGGRITALVPSRDTTPRLLVFKEDAIAVVSPKWGSSSSLIPGAGDALDTIGSSVQLLTRGTGCVATRSALWVPGAQGSDVFFLARDGVRSLQRAENDVQTGAGLPISYLIPDWIDRINFDHADKAVAAVFENKYYLAVPMDGAVENTHVLCYDLFQQAWSLHKLQARDLRMIPFSADERLFFQNSFVTQDCSFTGLSTSESLSQVYRMFSGTEDPGGSQIAYKLQTRAFTFGSADRTKKWDHLAFLGTVEAGETHSMQVVYRVDFQDWTTIASAVVIGVPDPGVNFGTDPLAWTIPDKKLVQRRVDLNDAPAGTIIEFQFLNESDFAQPTIYNLNLTARQEPVTFDNSL